MNRELKEELGLTSDLLQVSHQDFMMAHLTKLAMYYMFAKEVSVEEFIKIERLSMFSEEYGKEVSKIRISILFFFFFEIAP